MAAATSFINVPDVKTMESTITNYVAKGFVVSNRTPNSTIMFKKKEFSILWAVIGFFLCLLPLLIYIIYYAFQSDQMVEIRVVSGDVAL